MPFRARAFALLLVILAGCSTVPSPAPPDVSLVPENDPPIAAPAPIASPKVAAAPLPAVLPTPTPPPAPVPKPPPVERMETWIPLERWCQEYGCGIPRRTVVDHVLNFSFATTNGTLSVKVGSQLARWNGTEFYLGFAPQMINGHPFVHSLDARKNFYPLLHDSSPAITNRIIVIDPGHGGMDTGTRNVVNGHFEKEFTLDWARRLQTLLATNGWTVWLTRTNDTAMKLPSRVALADQHQAALFISLHFNSLFPDREQAGLETYCLTPAGLPSNLTRGYSDNPALTFPNNNFDAQNLQCAIGLHSALLRVNGHADRGVRRARFPGVLQSQNRPAVLIEGGYLSNPREARHIADPAYRQKLAEAVAQALTEESTPRINLTSRIPAAPLTAQAEGKSH